MWGEFGYEIGFGVGRNARDSEGAAVWGTSFVRVVVEQTMG